jgi:hypothetical protein
MRKAKGVVASFWLVLENQGVGSSFWLDLENYVVLSTFLLYLVNIGGCGLLVVVSLMNWGVGPSLRL